MAFRPARPGFEVAPLDESERARHKRRNVVHSLLLLGGMVVLAGLCGWLMFGPDGMLGLGLGMALALGFGPQVSPRMVLRLYRAHPLRPVQAPELYALLERLCARAGLERCPELYYVPSAMLNAFAVGRKDDAAIAVTDGLLRHLSMREVAGVLAHELSHVRNDDLWLMNLADLVGRMTRFMTLFGLVLIVLGLPAWLARGQGPPILLIPLLVFAPQLTVLLQLALSRARELDADLDAAGLTGDPAGLASALRKLERYQGGLLERILMPGQRAPVPSLLRTHPPTEERVRRLQALSVRPRRHEPDDLGQGPFGSFGWPAVDGPPRARVLGFWY